MTPEIIGEDGLDDLNSYLAGEQAKIDAQMLEELESVLKPDKMPDQIRLQYALKVAEEYLNRRKYMGTAKWFEPGTEFGIEVCKKHKLFFDATGKYRQVMFRAANRCLVEGTLVATPIGPVAIEKLKVGDTVFDRYGKPTKVVATWDNGLADVVSMTCRGKEYFACTPNHKIDTVRVNSHEGRWDTSTNKECKVEAQYFTDRYYYARRQKPEKTSLGAVHVKEAYALGAMLGDGCCTCSNSKTLVISSKDHLVPEKVAKVLGATYKKINSNNYNWAISSPPFSRYEEWMHKKLCHQKTIDLDDVKTWDRESLIEFVAGLIDTDGGMSRGKDGFSLCFSNQSKSAVDAFVYAVLALWQESPTVRAEERDRYKNGPVFVASIRNPYKIKEITDELKDYLVHKYKANTDGIELIGKRSRPEAIRLTPKPLAEKRRVYDITVEHPEHFFLLANGISVSNSGKTLAGSFASATWLTGIYPDWWEGKKFQKPIKMWSAGKTGQTVRDTVQKELLGDLGHFGTGMIPKDRIAKVIMKPGVPGGVDSIQVYNDWGDPSICGFKSYDQRIDAFVGVALDAAHEDEEPPYMVHNETFARLTTTMGVLINTVTPITGLTPYLLNFEKQSDMLGGAERTVALNEDEQKEFEKNPRTKCIVAAGWSDAPWLDEQAKIDLLADTPPHLKESRMTGKPSLGSGSVYPVPLESVLIDNDDFSHKSHYKYLYAIDVGWNKTAITWGALDPDTDTLYIYDEYYMGEQRPEVHAVAVKAHGAWMPGVIDPASRGRSQVDGNKLITLYIQSGLQIAPANNAVEAGVMDVYQRLSAGKLKILKKCRNLQAEYMTYKRDINGKIIKENDHLMDSVRYMVVELHRARAKPQNNGHIGSGNGAKRYF